MKFKYLAHVMMKEQFVCDDPGARYEVTKSIGLWMADTSSVTKASIQAELTEDDIPSAAIADPLECHTVPTLTWWLLWRCIRTCETWFYLRVWNARTHSCLLSELLGKWCKETELSFAPLLLFTTHQRPGTLAHNTSISRHFGTSTTCSRNVAGTQLLHYVTLQAFNFVYVFANIH